MFAGKIIGRVVATSKYESLKGRKLLLVQPMTWDKKLKGDPLVAVDVVGSGSGEFVFYVASREAAVACGGTSLDDTPPIDAAIVGIIDGVNLRTDTR